MKRNEIKTKVVPTHQNCVGPKWNFKMKIKGGKNRAKIKQWMEKEFGIDEQTFENFINYYGRK